MYPFSVRALPANARETGTIFPFCWHRPGRGCVASASVFELDIEAGQFEFSAEFLLDNGKRLSAGYVEIERL